MQNLKLVLKRLFYVSRLTDVKNKKLRILISVLLANAIVTIDIGIIVIFSSLLANVVDDTNLIVKTILNLVNDYKFMIPLLVVIKITPFPALNPYNADAAGPLSTSIDSISAGFISNDLLDASELETLSSVILSVNIDPDSKGKPSTTING